MGVWHFADKMRRICKRRGARGQTCGFTLHTLFLLQALGTLVFYPITLLIEADCIPSQLRRLITAGMEAANTFGLKSPPHSSTDVTWTTGPLRVGELAS